MGSSDQGFLLRRLPAENPNCQYAWVLILLPLNKSLEGGLKAARAESLECLTKVS